jgi:hypothetical protein
MKLRFGFSGKRDAEGEARASMLKEKTRQALGLAGDVGLSVNEITCADPACPILETIILVMEPGKRTYAIKLHGAIDGLEGDALAKALADAPRG